MVAKNDSHSSEFILLGFSKDPELQLLLYVMFLTMYVTTVLGSLLIIVATNSDPHLHTPMYFFLANLSLNDICYVSTTVPKMLLNIQMHRKSISYEGCMSQIFFFFFVLFASLDDFLLTAMAYDRFVAICHPLHYILIMNPRLCGLLLLGCWVLSLFNSLTEVLMLLRLSFSPTVEIPHFFCELNQVIKLASSNTFVSDVVLDGTSVLLAGGPLLGIIYSYYKIVSSIRGISSAQSKYKAFSTCASHLSVVALFYFTSLGVYLSSEASERSYESTITSVLYTVVTPMLNPFIYSLRNKDIKRTLNTLLVQKTTKHPVILH